MLDWELRTTSATILPNCWMWCLYKSVKHKSRRWCRGTTKLPSCASTTLTSRKTNHQTPCFQAAEPWGTPKSQDLEHAIGFGAGVGASPSGQIGLAKGLPMSMKTSIVETRSSALNPCSCMRIMLSARENAESSTTVTISRIALVIIPESRPHIAGVSAGNRPSHALMHL